MVTTQEMEEIINELFLKEHEYCLEGIPISIENAHYIGIDKENPERYKKIATRLLLRINNLKFFITSAICDDGSILDAEWYPIWNNDKTKDTRDIILTSAEQDKVYQILLKCKSNYEKYCNITTRYLINSLKL